MRTLCVIATQISDDVHELDEDVAGEYAFELSDTLNDSFACTLVLDTFHETIPVKVLDDFEFTVQDPVTSQWLAEA